MLLRISWWKISVFSLRTISNPVSSDCVTGACCALSPHYVDRILERGEKIEILVDKSGELHHQSFQFEKKVSHHNRPRTLLSSSNQCLVIWIPVSNSEVSNAVEKDEDLCPWITSSVGMLQQPSLSGYVINGFPFLSGSNCCCNDDVLRY